MTTARSAAHPHFLLATDLDPAAAPHVAFAVKFADALGARTTLFHAVLPQPALVEAGATRDVLPQPDDPAVARGRLKDLAGRCASTLPVHVAVDAARDARDAILRAADRVDAAMILLPTHGRTGLQRAVLGSIAEQVLRRARRPVLLLTDRMLRRTPTATPGPVLVATDLSPLAVAGHAPAAALARRLGLPLLLLSVLPSRQPPPYGGGAPVAPPRADPQARIRERAQVLRRHAAHIGADVAAEVLVQIDDDPAASIVAAATQQEAGLLVLTTHGRSGIARMLRGSVAEHVVRHATVPVVCMPGPEDWPTGGTR